MLDVTGTIRIMNANSALPSLLLSLLVYVYRWVGMLLIFSFQVATHSSQFLSSVCESP